ncbi:MAG: translation initiation factor [Campylobacterales bacterium]|nr:translation initiation factor [Campylobacterales bacterium]
MRGKKLDLSIGAHFEDEWSVVEGKKQLSKKELLLPEKHQLFFKFEKRRGKPVTLIGPISLSKEQTEALLKKIKKLLGSGGSFKEEFMELQGDCKERLRELFTQEGFRFKK